MEKTGHTSKKEYDFNTSAHLEVCIKDIWYRVTANSFRSFDGRRRITQPTTIQKLGQTLTEADMETYEYNGPVYVLLTNQQVTRMDTQTVVTNPYMPKIKQTSLKNSNRT